MRGMRGFVIRMQRMKIRDYNQMTFGIFLALHEEIQPPKHYFD